MKYGSKVKFTYKGEVNVPLQTTITLSNNMVSEREMSDEEVFERLHPELKKQSMQKYVSNGVIFALRNLLKKYPRAYDVELEELQERSSGNGNAGGAMAIMLILGVILAVIALPLLVMLGMRGKLILKKFYKDCSGEAYDKFVKMYTFVGIGLYAVCAVMVAVDKIFKLNFLFTPAVYILLFGGVAYLVFSLFVVKKKMFGTVVGAVEKAQENISERKAEMLSKRESSNSQFERTDESVSPETVGTNEVMDSTEVTELQNDPDDDDDGTSTVVCPMVSPDFGELTDNSLSAKIEDKNSLLEESAETVQTKADAEDTQIFVPDPTIFDEQATLEIPKMPAPKKEDPKEKKPAHNKLILILLIIFIVLFVLSAVGFAWLYFKNNPIFGIGNDTTTEVETTKTPETTENEETEEIPEETTEEETTAAINVIDYIGYWTIENDYDRELTIHSAENGTVKFSLRVGLEEKFTEMVLSLSPENTASFTFAEEGNVVKGDLSFGEESVLLSITESSNYGVFLENLEFTILSMTSIFGQSDDEDMSDETTDEYIGSYDEGYDVGYTEGYEYGFDEGYDEGYIEGVSSVVDNSGDSGDTEDYILSFSSDRLLTFEDLYDLNEFELRIAKNEIYARHGLLFEDKTLQAYFNAQPWYYGYVEPTDFSYSDLSDIERTNIACIESYE